MMSAVRPVGVVFGILLALAPGCGDGSDGDGNFGEPIPTSVPADKRISDLTPAERDQLCTDLGQWAMTSAVTRASLPSTVAHLTSQPNSAACTVLQNKCPGAV